METPCRWSAQMGEWCAKHPWWVLAVACMITVLTGWAAIHLPVYTSRQALLPQHTETAKRFDRFLTQFGAASDLIVVLEGAPRTVLETFADELASRLRKHSEVGQVVEKLDTPFFLDHAYLLVPPDLLHYTSPSFLPLDVSLTHALSWISTHPSLATFDFRVAEPSIEAANWVLTEWQRWLTSPTIPNKIDWQPLLTHYNAEELTDGWFVSRDNKMLFLFVHPNNPSSAFEARQPFIEAVQKTVSTLQQERKTVGHPVPTVGLTGLPAIEYEEYIAIDKDIRLVIASSAGLIAFLIVVVVRSIRWAILIFLPMGLGAWWSLGWAYVTVGHLTLVTSSFLAILFGLGADYGIFTSSRIAEARQTGTPLIKAIGDGISASFSAVCIAGGASLCVFGTLTTVEFPGFAELGWVASGGVLCILIATWGVQPALYRLWPPKIEVQHSSATPAWLNVSLPRWLAFTVVICSISAAIVGGIYGISLPFSYDVLALLPRDSEAAYYQRRMVADSRYQAEVLIFTAQDWTEARRIVQEANAATSIARVQSLTALFPVDAEERLEKARQIGNEIALRSDAQRFVELSKAGVSMSSFQKLAALLEHTPELIDQVEEQAFSSGHTRLVEKLEKMRENIQTLSQLISVSVEETQWRTEVFYRNLLETARLACKVAETWQTAAPLTPDMLPISLKGRFFGNDGTLAIYAFPKKSVYDPANLDELVRDAYHITHEVTGFPITHAEFSKTVVDSFGKGTLRAVGICLLWLVLTFRNGRGTILAAMPLLIGGGWMLGLMALGRFTYHYANIIALPLVIALAVDYGVWYAHRWLDLKDAPPFQVTWIAGKVIVLAAGTELAGLGGITLAHYQGVSELGIDITLGLLSCLAATLFVTPAIGQLLTSKPIPKL